MMTSSLSGAKVEVFSCCYITPKRVKIWFRLDFWVLKNGLNPKQQQQLQSVQMEELV